MVRPSYALIGLLLSLLPPSAPASPAKADPANNRAAAIARAQVWQPTDIAAMNLKTGPTAPKGFAPIAIGLGLTLIHLVSIPVTNTSVNPARSIGVAWFAGGAALAQVWLFIVAPIIGAAIAGISYAKFTGENPPIDEGIANNP